jgi:hypothetical protein
MMQSTHSTTPEQAAGFNLRRILKPLRKFVSNTLYNSDLYMYFVYPKVEQLNVFIKSLLSRQELSSITVVNLLDLASEHGWPVENYNPATIQECEASKTIVEDSFDLVKQGRLRLTQFHESRICHSVKRGELYYSHLYGMVRYPIRETFTCEMPNAIILGSSGFVMTPELEMISQSTAESVAQLTVLLNSLSSASTSFPPQPIPGKYVSLVGKYSAANYAHWLMDYLPRLALLDPSQTDFKVIVNVAPEAYRLESLELLGVSSDRIFEVKEECLCFENLLFCHAADKMGVPKAVHLYKMRERLVTAATGTAYHPSPNRRIYISRAKASRRISNENELLPILREYGFEVINCEDYKLADQIRIFSEANVVAGAHGAGIFNQIFCNPGATVIEIFNRQRWEHAPRKISSLLKHRHWHIFGENVDRDWNTQVDPQKFQKVLSYALDDCTFKEGSLYEKTY